MSLADIGFIMVLLFTLPEVWAEWLQGRRIRSMQTGTSVPVSTNSIDIATFFASAIYGLLYPGFSWAYFLNGLLTGLAFFYVGVGLRKYRRATWRNYVLDLFLIGNLILMVVVDQGNRELLMTGFLLYTLIGESKLLHELWRDGRGAVEFKKVMTWLVSNISFTIYGYAIQDPVFLYCCGAISVVQAIQVVVYLRAPPREEESSAS